MATRYLGAAFDIHGGGLDLVFPHHENELAQSRALGHEFARIWMHNGMLQTTGEKMAKSVGNIVSLKDAVDRWGPETLLLFFLGGHWRKPIDLSEETVAQARAQAQSFRDAFVGWDGEPGDIAPELADALEDDFNTPEALALMHRWRDHDLLRRGLAVFGLESLGATEEAPPEAVDLARQRQAARAARDYAEADRLREAIDALGWEVRDAGDGFQLLRRR